MRKPKKPKKPKIEQTFGTARCLFCDAEFERKRQWGVYCGDYCRTALWAIRNRRKRTESGVYTIKVNGVERSFEQGER